MRTLVPALLLALATSLFAQSPVIDRASALLAAGEPDKAIDVLEPAVAAHPNDALLHYWLGAAYGREAQQASVFRQLSLAKSARTELERAVALDPNLLDARFGLMEYYIMAPSIAGGDPEKARQQAAEIRKRDAVDGHRALAIIASHEKKPEVARAEYLAAVREQPSSARAHYWLGVFYMTADKNYKAAMQEFDAAAAYAPAWFQVGHVAALAGTDLARGEQSLLKYLATKPSHDDPPLARAHYWLGVIYEKQGKKQEARTHFETALRLQPRQKDVSEALKRVS
jgi:Tfp pilus assembly protein PilF